MAAEKIYEVEVPEEVTLEEGLAQAREKAQGVGILIEGDVRGGTFQGPAVGRYTVAGRTLRLEVAKKPAFIPWAMVEMGLKQVFGEVRCAS